MTNVEFEILQFVLVVSNRTAANMLTEEDDMSKLWTDKESEFSPDIYCL